MQNAKSERRFPVRQESEPFRSRRISSPSFAQGCHAELEVKHASGIQLVRGQVLDVSVGGVGALLPLTSQEAKAALLPGTTINNLVLEYFGSDLYRGSAVVAHSAETGQGLRLGLSLESGSLDLHTLHRQTFRLAFRHRWQHLIDTLSSRTALLNSASSVPDGVSPEFAVWVAAQQFFFQEVQIFLERAEQDSLREDLVTHHQNMEDMLVEASPDMVQGVSRFVEEISGHVERLPQHLYEAHKVYACARVQQYLLQGTFYHRALTKPLGYAGDYELMNMLYRTDPEGDSLFAKVLSIGTREQQASRAVINRLDYLSNIIIESIEQTDGARCRIASIGCGAAREISTFLTRRPDLGSRVEFALVDQDLNALLHCERSLVPLARATGARFQFIGEPIRHVIDADQLGDCLGERDLIYSAGLFDYLDDVTFRQLTKVLYRALKPSGLLVVGNMGTCNPARNFMEFILDWYLIHRSPDELLQLAASFQHTGNQVDVKAEPTGINLFLHVRRHDPTDTDKLQCT